MEILDILDDLDTYWNMKMDQYWPTYTYLQC
jgi:hypothetical protein